MGNSFGNCNKCQCSSPFVAHLQLPKIVEWLINEKPKTAQQNGNQQRERYDEAALQL